MSCFCLPCESSGKNQGVPNAKTMKAQSLAFFSRGEEVGGGGHSALTISPNFWLIICQHETYK